MNARSLCTHHCAAAAEIIFLSLDGCELLLNDNKYLLKSTLDDTSRHDDPEISSHAVGEC